MFALFSVGVARGWIKSLEVERLQPQGRLFRGWLNLLFVLLGQNRSRSEKGALGFIVLVELFSME